jgi:hypothetical protein
MWTLAAAVALQLPLRCGAFSVEPFRVPNLSLIQLNTQASAAPRFWGDLWAGLDVDDSSAAPPARKLFLLHRAQRHRRISEEVRTFALLGPFNCGTNLFLHAVHANLGQLYDKACLGQLVLQHCSIWKHTHPARVTSASFTYPESTTDKTFTRPKPDVLFAVIRDPLALLVSTFHHPYDLVHCVRATLDASLSEPCSTSTNDR